MSKTILIDLNGKNIAETEGPLDVGDKVRLLGRFVKVIDRVFVIDPETSFWVAEVRDYDPEKDGYFE